MDVKKYIGWTVKGIRHKIQKMKPTQKRMMIVAVAALIIGCILGGTLGRKVEQKRSAKKIEEAVAKVQKKADDDISLVERRLYNLQEQVEGYGENLPWNLVLVNSSHPMEEGYVPELKELKKGYGVDIRIAKEAKQMLADAEASGLHIQICSAYRSVDRQKKVFDTSMKERVRDGMGYWEAYEETTLNVAIPGASEHALGLALDLISSEHSELDKRQESTLEAKWLKENCYKYGFVLRYPPEKTNITGIMYEPWHYRYVGKEHAAKMKELGVTLEEYLQEHYQSQEGEK